MNENVRGEGISVFDGDGNRYIDLFVGDGEGNLGHCHPLLTKAIQEQATKFVAPQSPSQSSLGTRLSAQLQERLFAGRVAFVHDRSGAVELALWYARLRHQGQRHKVISFVGSDHGLTLGSLTASGRPYLQAGLGPLVAGANYCPYGDLDAVESTVDEQTTAILVQPIQTRDGVTIPEPSFLAGLRRLADEHGLLLIFDEGDIPLGMTGEWLAAQALGGEPDCVTIAAGLAGGLPLAAVLLRQSIAEEMEVVLEEHPSVVPTAVSPLLLAASLAVLETIDTHGMLETVIHRGEMLQRCLQSLNEDFDFVDGVRCQGMIAGLELDVPLPPLVLDLQRRGVLVGRSNATTLRLQLPLDVEEPTIETVGEVFRQAFEAVEREPVDV